MIPNIPIDERETTINLFYDDKTAKVYTSDNTMITKLDGLCKSAPESYKKVKSDEYGAWYEFPKEFISFRSKKPEVNLTPEQRAERAERMRNLRKK